MVSIFPFLTLQTNSVVLVNDGNGQLQDIEEISLLSVTTEQMGGKHHQTEPIMYYRQDLITRHGLPFKP